MIARGAGRATDEIDRSKIARHLGTLVDDAGMLEGGDTFAVQRLRDEMGALLARLNACDARLNQHSVDGSSNRRLLHVKQPATARAQLVAHRSDLKLLLTALSSLSTGSGEVALVLCRAVDLVLGRIAALRRGGDDEHASPTKLIRNWGGHHRRNSPRNTGD